MGEKQPSIQLSLYFIWGIKQKMRRRRNKRKNITKIGFTFTILLLLLVSIGASYSAWTDEIYITGIVTTGEWLCEETAWARMHNLPDDFTHEFPGANWATYIKCQPTENTATFYLYAAQHYRVGELQVWRNTTHLFVEYHLDIGYEMSESHLHIATSLDGIPQKNGNPIPGQFDYKENHDPYVSSYTYMISWDSNWDNQELYIAAHGVVWGIY